jgi:hypothetical protein
MVLDLFLNELVVQNAFTAQALRFTVNAGIFLLERIMKSYWRKS